MGYLDYKDAPLRSVTGEFADNSIFSDARQTFWANRLSSLLDLVGGEGARNPA